MREQGFAQVEHLFKTAGSGEILYLIKVESAVKGEKFLDRGINPRYKNDLLPSAFVIAVARANRTFGDAISPTSPRRRGYDMS